MATYCIGDIQGCYAAYQLLLEKISFSPSRDKLYILGDMVNRGENSLAVLRSIKDFGSSAACVLGNHDLHLLAIAYTNRPMNRHDSIANILTAPDREELLTWLRQQKLAIYANDILMLHAGVLPQWEPQQVLQYAIEVEHILQSDDFISLLENMYGNWPDKWSDTLEGWDRVRLIINAFTRIRYCTADGTMDFKQSTVLNSTATTNLLPWFDLPQRQTAKQRIAFGHWSTLGWQPQRQDIYSLDTGCVWGGKLSAIEIDSSGALLNLIQVDNPQPIKPIVK